MSRRVSFPHSRVAMRALRVAPRTPLSVSRVVEPGCSPCVYVLVLCQHVRGCNKSQRTRWRSFPLHRYQQHPPCSRWRASFTTYTDRGDIAPQRLANHASGTSNERAKSEKKLSQVHQQPLPNSQESYVSTSSSTSAPRLQSSLSDLSNPSIPETALTSPTASDHSQGQSETPQKSQLAEKPASSERQEQPRARTPNIDIAAANAKRDSVNSTQTSPMSIDTPGLTHGSKRTASGLVKPAMPDTPASPVTATPCKHSRTTSLDSNNGHRIGEVRAHIHSVFGATRLTSHSHSSPPN